MKAGFSSGFLPKGEEQGDIHNSNQDYSYTNESPLDKTDVGYFLNLGYSYSLS